MPVFDTADQLIGVITDRDIVCRVVAEGKNPIAHTAEQYMSQPVVTVRSDAPLDEVLSTMEKHQIWRVPVVDERGCCAGIIAQAGTMRFPGYQGGTMMVSGNRTGNTGTFTMTMPAGSMMTGACAATATGTFDMDDMMTQLRGTYTGTNSCGGRSTAGRCPCCIAR